MRRLHPLPGSTHSPHYIEHSRLSCGYSLTVDTCDLKHSRQRRSPSRTVAHSDTESACVLHLFGRARSRLLCPRSDRRTPSGLCRVSSHRSIHPACICLPPPPFSSGSRAGADHCSPRLNARRQATWMRPCMGRLNHLHIKATPGRSSRPHGRLRRLGNCADERLGGCCLSSLQSLALS